MPTLLFHYRWLLMDNKTSKVIIGAVSVILALFLAWRIGLWLEPEPAAKSSVQTLSSAAKQPPFASGKTQEGTSFELRNVRIEEEGKSIKGIGIVRFDITREELKPVAIAMLRTLKEKVPAVERISLSIKPSVDCPVCTIAQVAYIKGQTVLSYGTPSLEQINSHNARIGSSQGSGKTSEQTPLYLPDRQTFGNGLAVTMAIDAARKKNPLMAKEQILKQASAATGLPEVMAERYRDFMAAYYTGNTFGTKTFDILPR